MDAGGAGQDKAPEYKGKEENGITAKADKSGPNSFQHRRSVIRNAGILKFIVWSRVCSQRSVL